MPAVSRRSKSPARPSPSPAASSSAFGCPPASTFAAPSAPLPTKALAPREDFFWDVSDEPHASRRQAILKAHPEVRSLMGHEWKSKYLCLFLLVIPQIWLSWATQDLPWLPYLAVAYVFGATITQSLFLAIHELAHNLFFKKPQHNRYFSMVANWPIGIPYCVPFRGYHLEHHKWQGVDGIDTDIPSELEGRLIRGPVTKTIWACCQILTYALRPMFIKAQDVTRMHVLNWVAQIAFDVAIFYFWGWKPLAYFVLCIFLAGGLHPCAGHFISEHYVFPHLDEKQETYSCAATATRAAPPLPCRVVLRGADPRLPAPLQVLRLAQHLLLERRLPQRAPRLPLRRVVEAARAQADGARVLRQPRRVRVVDRRDRRLHPPPRDRPVQPREARGAEGDGLGGGAEGDVEGDLMGGERSRAEGGGLKFSIPTAQRQRRRRVRQPASRTGAAARLTCAPAA